MLPTPPPPRRSAPGRIAAPILTALTCALLGLSPSPVRAIPPVSAPECIANCPSDAPASSGTREQRSGPNIVERIQQAWEARAARRRAEAHEQNERGVAEFKRGNYAEALRLFRQAEDGNPDDGVIRQNVKNAESALANQRREQERQAALAREQEAYRQEARKLAALMPTIRVVTAPTTRRDRQRVPPLGYPSDRWLAYLDAQEAVDVLYDKVNRGTALTDAEAQTFFEALRRRNALWAEAQGRPLDDADRQRLRLSLPATVSPSLSRTPPPPNAPPSAPDRRTDPAQSDADALTNAFTADHLSDQMIKVGDRAVGDWLGEAFDEATASRYERLIGLARVAVKATKGGAEAAAELADFAISRMPEPLTLRAELAKEGGRIYSYVTFKALDRFMVDAMNGVGASFDPVAFRKQVKEELSQSQKGVTAWSTGE